MSIAISGYCPKNSFWHFHVLYLLSVWYFSWYSMAAKESLHFSINLFILPSTILEWLRCLYSFIQLIIWERSLKSRIFLFLFHGMKTPKLFFLGTNLWIHRVRNEAFMHVSRVERHLTHCTGQWNPPRILHSMYICRHRSLNESHTMFYLSIFLQLVVLQEKTNFRFVLCLWWDIWWFLIDVSHVCYPFRI